ncbi:MULTISPECIES: hypothetical protein [unclassified Leptospira]|uniref:LA_3696 family protein n=1 Tax=unclassified Leptospira TaxID=2633828 RepID=UPI0002BEF731|nr:MULTISPECIES: hypothetical protein [unclassified Leptospira]EMJ99723.1 hypothetical protein LEP1GSC192_0915 [Leptospira sp. B5-022]MCR1793980.1 hypothetical protein [Leptospira sp. id769339]
MTEPILLVPKALRNSLGEEGAEALVSLLNQANSGGKKFMEEFVSERFERRLMEETGKLRLELKEETGKLWIAISELRAEMHAGFAGIQEQFKEVYKEIANIHKSIASQTRWMVAVIIASVLPIYLGLAKLIFQ